MNDPIVLPKARQMGRGSFAALLAALSALGGYPPLPGDVLEQLEEASADEEARIARAEAKRARKLGRGPGFSRRA